MFFCKKPREGKGKASLKAKTPGFAPENTACLAKALRQVVCFYSHGGEILFAKACNPALQNRRPPMRLAQSAEQAERRAQRPHAQPRPIKTQPCLLAAKAEPPPMVPRVCGIKNRRNPQYPCRAHSRPGRESTLTPYSVAGCTSSVAVHSIRPVSYCERVFGAICSFCAICVYVR